MVGGTVFINYLPGVVEECSILPFPLLKSLFKWPSETENTICNALKVTLTFYSSGGANLR